METTNPIYRVVLEHPEYGIERHEVAVGGYDYNPFDGEDAYDEYVDTLLTMLEEKYNPYHIWHEMHVYADYYIDGKMYTSEIVRKEDEE
jgi:hypothetical protein